MPEQNFTEIGRLHVQVQFNEKELEGLRREGNENSDAAAGDCRLP